VSCFGTERENPVVTHRIDGTSVALAVVNAVAAVENARPTALPPLAETVDVEALATLVESADPLRVTFDYCEHDVVVTPETVELY